ncbi:MAG TPA: hypothetical protein VFA76_06220 [Terriglobales bacterium]|nr:hypothetical protein [Terriglobales bacterium]
MLRLPLLTLGLLFAVTLFSGAWKKPLHQLSSHAGTTSSIVQVADDEGGSSDTPGVDPDTVEQGPDGDGNVEG